MRDIEPYFSVMENCPLFQQLPPEKIRKITAGADIVELRKGEFLTLPEKLQDILLVLSGRLNIFLDSGMNTSLVHTLQTGNSFGAAFCVQGIPCHNRIEAAESALMLRIPYVKLLEETDCREQILKNLLAITSNHLHVLSEKISHTQSRSVRTKLSVYLRDRMHRTGSSRFDLGMKRTALSEYLCVSYPAMARELREMQNENLILLENDSVTVLDEENLIERGAEDTLL